MTDPRSARAEGAARRADLAQGQQRTEAVKAQRLIDAFVAEARQRGLAPERLRARLMSGAEARTDRSGWYLRRDRSVAIGENGEYFVLLVPGGLAARVRGVKLTATPPPLVVGRGGPDGEAGELAEFLRRRLEQG